MADHETKSPKKRKTHKARKIIIIVVLLLLIAGGIIGVYFLQEYKTRQFEGYEVIYSAELNGNAATNYLTYSGGYLKINRDGAEAVNSLGSQIWNVTYRMNAPIAAVCGDYVVVGDQGAQTIYMMDGTGTVYTTTAPYPISEVEATGVGVAAIRMNDGLSDYIQLIDLAGTVLVEIKTLENKDGFPVDIAISEDGTKLVTSYLVIDEDSATGWLTFYNFAEVGQNYTDNLTGVFKYDEILPQVAFMDNNTVCVQKKDGAALYSVPELPSLITELTCAEPILHCARSNKYLAFVVDNTKAGTVCRTYVYDKRGTLVFDKTGIEDFDAVVLSGEDIVFNNKYACLILRMDGTVKFNSAIGGSGIETIMPTDKNERFLLFGDTIVETIQLIHLSE